MVFSLIWPDLMSAIGESGHRILDHPNWYWLKSAFHPKAAVGLDWAKMSAIEPRAVAQNFSVVPFIE